MRSATIAFWAALAGTISPTAGGAPAVSTGIEFSTILDVCEALTLDEAATKGERLGWPVASEDREWRASFERHNGGPVQIVGWRQGEREGDGLLSYWVASGPNAHRACAFSTDQPGLFESLRSRFGNPDTYEQKGDIISAFWQRVGADVSFTRVGMSSVLNLSRRD